MYVQVEATVEAVGANVDAKYTASRPAVSNVVVIGKWTVAGSTEKSVNVSYTLRIPATYGQDGSC